MTEELGDTGAQWVVIEGVTEEPDPKAVSKQQAVVRLPIPFTTSSLIEAIEKSGGLD
ncbi:hypothetical protein [Aliiruegeria haliotis]|uniref:hypothetical protein n=1 Tax=Aliiruegeria haliotis TaxID=1280846 RepID=UPI001304DECF|nr:hypothetical protein [Aliiruegeria haliotis]